MWLIESWLSRNFWIESRVPKGVFSLHESLTTKESTVIKNWLPKLNSKSETHANIFKNTSGKWQSKLGAQNKWLKWLSQLSFIMTEVETKIKSTIS